MAVGVKHYFKDGKEYKGATHKTNGQLMSGKTHTASSKPLTHTPGKKKAMKKSTVSYT